MAVTSSFSAEIVAHASIVTYDIYQPCENSIHLISIAFLFWFFRYQSYCNREAAQARFSFEFGWICDFLSLLCDSAQCKFHFDFSDMHAHFE
jgi:hypothetical protein